MRGLTFPRRFAVSAQYLPRRPGDCANYAVAITPSDSADVAGTPVVVYVGVTGDLCLVPANADTNDGVVFKNVPVGFFPVNCRRVKSTGTTATQLIGVW